MAALGQPSLCQLKEFVIVEVAIVLFQEDGHVQYHAKESHHLLPQ